ncbi:MAG: threonine synthase [Limnochordia bacterium]
MVWRGVIEQYRSFLPVDEHTPVISLLEGDTPLVPADNLARILGIGGRLYLKYEGLNPTGSFKDRGMTLAVSKAVEQGSKAVMCASTGNTSASAAAYAARAGISAIVLIPEGAIAMGKLSQALMHGSRVLAVRGNFDDALRLVRQITQTHPITLVNSLNPYRIEGQKTAAFEICEALGEAPDLLAIPVGNAGNITAYWKGFCEYRRAGHVTNAPRMLGFQAAGSAPIVIGEPVADPQTLATAIKIGNPASWKQAEAARDESEGLIEAVTDEQIVEAYSLLAEHEGVFCEPASAASVAGIIQLQRQGRLEGEPTIVCVLTGHGLKDPDRAIAESPEPEVIEPVLAAVEKAVLSGISL